jgi:CubicO group peptidase (beta-lactamase class C family)
VPPEFPGRFSELSRALRDTLEAAGMGGASWAFVTGDEILAHEVFGFADLETGRRVDDATIYHWGSITKTLTGISVMQLRDRGLLSLDDPILRYVPELREVHNPYGSMEEITLRQLLSHSAGFRGPTWPWGGGEDWHPHEPTRWEQLVAMMPYTEILFPPGSRFSYSNPGIVFLGQVIERLSGEEWEVYVEKNILRPLGMHRSYFDYTPYHLLGHRSNNYTVVDGVPVANGLDFDTGITVSNGGLNAPVPDMARYLAFLTGSGDQAAREGYAGILARTSLEEMWQEEVPVGESGSLREAMGLCFFLEEYGGHTYVGHTGSQKAFQAFIYLDPVTRTGAIAAFNSTGAGPEGTARPATRQILNRLRERMFQEIFPLFR